MEETVVYDFRANGIREVQQAFQSVEQAMLKAEKAALDSARREALGRLNIANETSKKRIELEKKALGEITNEEKLLVSRHEAHAKAREELTRRSVKKRKDEELDLYRSLAKLEEEHTKKLADEAKKRAQIEADHIRDITQRRRQFASTVSGAAVGSVRSMIGATMQVGAAALTLGGGLSVTAAATRAMSAENASVALANSMFNPNDKEQQAWLAKNGKGGRFDNKQIIGLASRAQALYGIDKDELARGWQDYVAKSSDWKAIATPEGQQTMLELAKYSKATGTDFGQLMGAAGSLRVQNENLKPNEMLEMMRAIIGQGKMGAVEMKDLAAHASVVTSGAGSYGMEHKKAQQALLGLSQIAIQTSGSPAEAATAVARFGSDVQHHAKDMKSNFGIDAIADKKTGALKSPSEILAEIFEKTGGNTAKFGEGKGNVGLGRESVRIANALAPKYREAVDTARAKGEVDETKLAHIGAEAVRNYVQRFENAGYDKKNIDEDLTRVMATTSERFNKVTKDLLEKLEARVIPFLEKLAVVLEKDAPQIEKFMNALAKAANWLAENPWEGIGAVIAGKLTADIAAAAVGQKVQETLTTLIKNSMGAGSAAGSPGALGGVGIGTAGLIAAGATMQISALYADVMEVKQWRDAGKAEGESIAAAMKSGDPDRVAAAKTRLNEANDQASTIRTIASYINTGINTYSDALTFGASRGLRTAGESAVESVTGRKYKDQNLETLKAKELIDAYDIKMTTSKAIREGIQEGASSANPNSPHRREPIGFKRD